jgi:hypothetical protein
LTIAETRGESALGQQESIMRRNQLLAGGFFNISHGDHFGHNPWGKRKGNKQPIPQNLKGQTPGPGSSAGVYHGRTNSMIRVVARMRLRHNVNNAFFNHPFSFL